MISQKSRDISQLDQLQPTQNVLVRSVVRQFFETDPEYQKYNRPAVSSGDTELVDYLFGCQELPHRPEDFFNRLRWGGIFVYVGKTQQEVLDVQKHFDNRGGFVINSPCCYFRSRFLGMRLPLPLLTHKGFYFTARKVLLIPPGELSERFTYHVELLPSIGAEHGYVVLKQVPSYENVLWRLQKKHADVDPAILSKRARKLVENVFPVFLTREAAILRQLNRDMPAPYNTRVPRVVSIQKDDRGFVRRLETNWLRMSGPILSQIDFACQSIDLLRVLHDQGKMMHLDLRLDNIVICEGKVSFVDFGSAVRVGEDLSESPLLASLFSEIMQTSQIQCLLGKWKQEGKITNRAISNMHQKTDKAIDYFYLAVQMNQPFHNPEFRGLVEFDNTSREAIDIAKLTTAILRPKNVENSPHQSAQDILQCLIKIKARLEGQPISPKSQATPPTAELAVN